VPRIAVCQVAAMQVVSLDPQVSRLVEELAQYHGYRTLWLDRRGYLCHSEPEDEFEELGFAYVATVMRPNTEEVTKALTSFTARRASRVGAWPVAAALRMSSVPALVPA
jgi:hypothetical protein